jgi:hypothetical protein
MGYIIEGAGLTVLGWIAYSLYRLVRFIQHEHAVAECSPDSEYPAFPRRQIQAAVEQLDEHKLKSHLENEQWAALDEDKRRDVVQEAAYAEHLLLRHQFMIEANLMVRRGELTIAEAEHILDSEIRTPSYASISSIATKDGRLLRRRCVSIKMRHTA